MLLPDNNSITITLTQLKLRNEKFKHHVFTVNRWSDSLLHDWSIALLKPSLVVIPNVLSLAERALDE